MYPGSSCSQCHDGLGVARGKRTMNPALSLLPWIGAIQASHRAAPLPPLPSSSLVSGGTPGPLVGGRAVVGVGGGTALPIGRTGVRICRRTPSTRSVPGASPGGAAPVTSSTRQAAQAGGCSAGAGSGQQEGGQAGQAISYRPTAPLPGAESGR